MCSFQIAQSCVGKVIFLHSTAINIRFVETNDHFLGEKKINPVVNHTMHGIH